ncbi:FAD-binding oxidoreductase [Nocardioides panaciterrulae]|uniref:FAD/FMN-containing dehydrogenase n=1 Tax=Nocardioides panaciterrulae TaxID=661492 RepID=A0A7Y9J9P8_9ACTN|nr:FAD-binding oxidoreductase [Nocardioides panaciterrulae]NYD40837.1 FAD/FMN-containing dehydrogenase [Nocardioides panaciterrulae]
MTQPYTGTTIRPGEPGYDEARRVFNGLIDRSPERILRPRDTDEVAAAVESAVGEGRPVSVYGGGHGVTGSAVVDGGTCLDLRALDTVEVWPQERLLKVGGGARWGAVDAATQAHGLAVTGGRVSTTGVAGLALGSGSGWLERRCGLTCDNLVEARVVTADGRRVTASSEQNPDLFWALRGGGGNFGIVTEFIFRLHEIGPIVLGGMLLYPGTQAADVITTWRELVDGAPEELGSAVALITAPPADFVPEPARGHPAVGVVVCWTGDLERGRRLLAPLRALGPAADLVQPMPYTAVQQLLDQANPPGLHNYWSADFLTDLPDRAVETLVAEAQPAPSPFTQVILMHGGGAVARVGEEETAFGQRRTPFNLHFLGMWPPDHAEDARNIGHIRGLVAAMKPWAAGNAYLNFIGDEGLTRVEAAFGPAKFGRLRAIKEVWDPHNVFRHNQNIPPLRERGRVAETPTPVTLT